MFFRKFRASTLIFLLFCALSAGSYGFLVGKTYEVAQSKQAEVRAVAGQLQTTGSLVARGMRTLKFLLIK